MKPSVLHLVLTAVICITPSVHASHDLDRPLRDWLTRSQAVVDPSDEKMLDERTKALYRDWRTISARSAMSEGILRTMRPFLHDDGIRVFRTMMSAFGLPTDLNQRQMESFARNSKKRLFTDILDVMQMLDVPTEGLRSAGIYFVVDAVRVLRQSALDDRALAHLTAAERTELHRAIEAHLATKLEAVDVGDGWISPAETRARVCAEVLASISTEDLVGELHRRLVLKKD